MRARACGLCTFFFFFLSFSLFSLLRYRVAIGHVVAPALAALLGGTTPSHSASGGDGSDGSNGSNGTAGGNGSSRGSSSGGGGSNGVIGAQLLPPDLRNTAMTTLAALSQDQRTVEALVATGSVRAVARVLNATMEEDVLVLVLDVLVRVAAAGGARGCAAFLETAHENDLMKFVELLPPTPLQSEPVTSRALRLLAILCGQASGLQQIMALDGFLDKMLSSCQDPDYPEYRAALQSIAQVRCLCVCVVSSLSTGLTFCTGVALCGRGSVLLCAACLCTCLSMRAARFGEAHVVGPRPRARTCTHARRLLDNAHMNTHARTHALTRRAQPNRHMLDTRRQHAHCRCT
jgi:hypothetical protein